MKTTDIKITEKVNGIILAGIAKVEGHNVLFRYNTVEDTFSAICFNNTVAANRFKPFHVKDQPIEYTIGRSIAKKLKEV